MKIGLVAPSPVPFTVGGAEKLFWGLLREINSNTSHQAELIKIPTREHNFWDLVDSYEKFFRLDVSHFDLVVSTKYPSWMISHPNHVCYMVHTLRGFYDTFHYLKLPTSYETTHPGIKELQRLLNAPRPNRASCEEVFQHLQRLRAQPDTPPDAFQFPGSLIKEVVHYFDRVGLRKEAVRSYCAISQTVADRRSYFPRGAQVKVIHPPSNLEDLHSGPAEYLFTASRLDGPKRIALLIAAMRLVTSQVQLRIAGEGPEAERLKQLAGNDDRIVFLGYRSDAELVEDYAKALAVLFVPQEEDYGLITVEAMMCGKPVITVTDSGGPTEFVEQQRTGLCVAPEPTQIAAAIELLLQEPERRTAMGKAARARVEIIQWPATVAALLDMQPTMLRNAASKRRAAQLTVATTFPITPVRGGGQARIFHLYKSLAPTFCTEIVTLAQEHEPAWAGEIAPGVREIRIPKSKAHAEAEREISAQVDWFPVTDVVFPELVSLTPDYCEALERSTRNAEVLVACHPYVLPALESISDKPFWYEAQDVECSLKGNVIPPTPRGLELIEAVSQLEKRCCEKADLILACSEADAEELARHYVIPKDKFRIVPNGVDTRLLPFISRREAAAMRKRLGVTERFAAIFMGSWHQPNLQAIETIMQLAAELPEVDFLLMGSSCAAFATCAKPSNVGLFGEVDDETKQIAFSTAQAALNPMRHGSGTNLKMLEYAAAGIPIITTSFGMRGLGFVAEKELLIREAKDFAEGINRIAGTPIPLLDEMTRRARQRVEDHFDWSSVGKRFLEGLELS